MYLTAVQQKQGIETMKKITTQVGTDLANLCPVNTFVSAAKVEGKATVRVTKDPKVTAVDEATFARLVDVDFKNGVIEVTVLSKLLAVGQSRLNGIKRRAP